MAKFIYNIYERNAIKNKFIKKISIIRASEVTAEDYLYKIYPYKRYILELENMEPKISQKKLIQIFNKNYPNIKIKSKEKVLIIDIRQESSKKIFDINKVGSRSNPFWDYTGINANLYSNLVHNGWDARWNKKNELIIFPQLSWAIPKIYK